MTAHHCHDCGHDFADDLGETDRYYRDESPIADDTYTLWGFHVALEHSGDHAAAARHVRALMPPRPRRARCPHCGSTNTEVRT